MKIGDEVFVHGFVDEIRKDVIIIRNNGGYFGTVSNEITVINGATIATPFPDKRRAKDERSDQPTGGD